MMFLNGMPASLLIPISTGLVLLLSATKSTWSSHGVVELLSVPSNSLIALSAAVDKGCLLIRSKLFEIFSNSLMTRVICVVIPGCYTCVVIPGWMRYCTFFHQDAQHTCWMSTYYHHSSTFDVHFHHACFSSSVVLGRCLACYMVSSFYPWMKVTGMFSCTFLDLLHHIVCLSPFAVGWLFQLVVAGLWIVSLVYLLACSNWWPQCCFPDHSEYLSLH